MRTPRIVTERLTLDSLLPSDAGEIFRYCQDPEIHRWVHTPEPYGMPDAEYFTGTYAANAANSAELTLWSIRSGTAMLGVIELRHEPLASATIGYWLGAEHRTRGYMTEAVLAVTDYALSPEGFDLQRVHWEAFVGNRASATVAHRGGFTYEGMLRQSTVHRDRRVDSWHGSLLRTDTREPKTGWPL
jgi:RimJ/RimL family protein N-acetyltransferase